MATHEFAISHGSAKQVRNPRATVELASFRGISTTTLLADSRDQADFSGPENFCAAGGRLSDTPAPDVSSSQTSTGAAREETDCAGKRLVSR
jgi:hypothetical protein